MGRGGMKGFTRKKQTRVNLIADTLRDPSRIAVHRTIGSLRTPSVSAVMLAICRLPAVLHLERAVEIPSLVVLCFSV